MNYDSRSTWDSGLDAGSIPARSIYCGKEAIGFFDGIEQAKKWLLDERRDLV